MDLCVSSQHGLQSEFQDNQSSKEKKSFFLNFSTFCLSVVHKCMSIHHIYVQCPQRPEKDIRSSGTGVTDG